MPWYARIRSTRRVCANSRTSKRPVRKPPTCAEYATPPEEAELIVSKPSASWSKNQKPMKTQAGIRATQKKNPSGISVLT